MSGQIGRQNDPKTPSAGKNSRFCYLECTFSPPRGVFSHTYFTPKSHVVKVAMLLFRLCAEERRFFCDKDWADFPRRPITDRDGGCEIPTGLRVLANTGRTCRNAALYGLRSFSYDVATGRKMCATQTHGAHLMWLLADR